jgi:hypothetical protein
MSPLLGRRNGDDVKRASAMSRIKKTKAKT